MLFSLRVNSLWNKLPSNVVSADTLKSFRSRLDALFGDKRYSCSKEEILHLFKLFFHLLELKIRA